MFEELSNPGRCLEVPDPRVGIATQKGCKIAALLGGWGSGSEVRAPGKSMRLPHFIVPEGFVDRLVAGQRPKQLEQPRRPGPRDANHDDGIGRVAAGEPTGSVEKSMFCGLNHIRMYPRWVARGGIISVGRADESPHLS
jgi:hypothetical protein